MAFYRPLTDPGTEIRLVTILPNPNETAPVHLILQHESLARPPAYEALSYTWKDKYETKESDMICVDGVQVKVFENLYYALKTLRRPCSPRLIWNDRICINQGDKEEKAIQLGLMRDVYEKANIVIAWLGLQYAWSYPIQRYSHLISPDPNSVMTAPQNRTLVSSQKVNTWAPHHAAVEAILSLIASGEPWPVAHHHRNQQSTYVHHGEILWTDIWSFSEYTKVLEDVMKDPYWQRVWVVQELTAARKIEVYLGPHVLEWALLRKAANIVDRHFQSCCQDRKGHTDMATATIDENLSYFSRIIVDIETTRQLYRSDTKLEPLLRRHRNKGATEYPDIIKALTNLVGDWGSGPHLNTSSETALFEDIVCSTLHSQIGAFKSLSILCGDVGTDDRDHDDAVGGALERPVEEELTSIHRRLLEPLEAEEELPLRLRMIRLSKTGGDRARKNLYSRSNLPWWAKCFACCGTLIDNGPLYTPPRFDYLNLYNATKGLPPAARLRRDRTLWVLGDLMDIIEFVSYPTLRHQPGYTFITLAGKLFDDSQEAVLQEWQTDLEEQIEEQDLLSKAGRSKRDLRMAFARALHCDMVLPGHQSGSEADSKARRLTSDEAHQHYASIYGSGDVDGKFDNSDAASAQASVTYNACAFGRKLFITAKGRVGLGSPAIVKGDVVAVLYGGSVPFVLRKMDRPLQPPPAKQNRYQLLGDCYCDGLMDGEGVGDRVLDFVLE